MTEAWDSVFAARCSQALTEKEANIWMLELRRAVTGWKHDPILDGPDPLKGEKVKEINADLCNVIRFTMDRGNPRRADSQRKQSRYTVTDLILWVSIWRRDGRIMDSRPDISVTDLFLINKMKPVIVKWAEEGRWDDIAFEIPMPYLIQNEGALPNMTLSEHGQKQLENWVLSEYGMNCLDRRYQWAKENSDRLKGIDQQIGALT